MQIICTVDIRTRELALEDVTIAAFDHLVDDILFDVEPIDGFELDTSTIKIAAVGPLGEQHDYEIDPSTVTVDEETGNINFVWSIPVGVTAMPLTSFKINDIKKITFAVCAEIVSGDNLVKAWHSNDGTIKVKAHLEPESGGGEDPSEEATNAQKIAALQRQVGAISSGAPPAADSTDDMDADVSTVYINTTDGKWYYWDGTAFQPGGTYGGAVTSTTFTEQGVPADDFAVGQALAGKADASDLAALETALESKADADDVDARFDTVEQAIEDVTFDGMDMLVTEISSTTYGGNLMDMSNATKTASNVIKNGILFHPSSGMFYSNPWGNPDGVQMTGYPKDADGNAVGMTVNGETVTELKLYSGTGYLVTYEFSDSTHFVKTAYANVNKYNSGDYSVRQEVVLSVAPAYWYCEGKGANLTHGITAEISTTYVPYVAPVVTHSYEYADALDEHIEEIAGSSGGIAALDTRVSAVEGDVESLAEDYEAVEDELYDRKGIEFETVDGWIRPSNGVLISGAGTNTATDFIPVTPGEVIRVHRPALQKLTNNAYYNASKSFVSALTTPSNVTDLTIPSGVYYVRFSDYNEGMVGFTVERTGLWTRIRDAIAESSGEAEYRNLIEQSRYGTNVLTLLHFSDLHMDNSTMGYINTFRTKYAEFLDDAIQTGDVSNGFESNWETLVSVGLGSCLGVIGNHEALGSSKNSATQQELHEKYIAPYISGWNVTQPTGVDDSTSEHYCANYYYKDYTDATVRLIVLDTQKWSSAQLTWFTSTLASARTAGYAVVVASHVLPGAVTITDCNFSARYASGSNVTHAFPTSDAPLVTEDAVSAVNDFITAGGEFTIWIGGHEHADIFGVFTNYPNVTAYMIDKASIERQTPGAARIRGEKNQHAFNIMSIVRGGKLVKFVRIGEDVDGMMRGKHVFCYNYNTKTIISQW